MAHNETCPYLLNEPVQVQVPNDGGSWAQGTVIATEPYESGLFGLAWLITIKLPHTTIKVPCDGDGWNHSLNRGVRPGFADEILDELKAVAS